MNDDLKQLPPPEKKVAAKVLDRLGFSYRQIGEIIDVSAASVMRYKEIPVPEELKQFETQLNLAFSDYEVILAAKAAARIDETLARARIGEALEVYKTMRRLDQPKVVQQFNTNGEMNIEFIK